MIATESWFSAALRIRSRVLFCIHMDCVYSVYSFVREICEVLYDHVSAFHLSFVFSFVRHATLATLVISIVAIQHF